MSVVSAEFLKVYISHPWKIYPRRSVFTFGHGLDRETHMGP
jgi:hypothetical protein